MGEILMSGEEIREYFQSAGTGMEMFPNRGAWWVWCGGAAFVVWLSLQIWRFLCWLRVTYPTNFGAYSILERSLDLQLLIKGSNLVTQYHQTFPLSVICQIDLLTA